MKKSITTLLTGLLFCQFACNNLQQSTKTVEYTQENSILSFSSSGKINGWLLLSGQIGIDSNKKYPELVKGGIQNETKAIMQAISSKLSNQGYSMDNIVKCTVMLSDMSDWNDFNAEYLKWFKNHKPLRSAFGVSGLALDAKAEVECMAYK